MSQRHTVTLLFYGPTHVLLQKDSTERFMAHYDGLVTTSSSSNTDADQLILQTDIDRRVRSNIKAKLRIDVDLVRLGQLVLPNLRNPNETITIDYYGGQINQDQFYIINDLPSEIQKQYYWADTRDVLRAGPNDFRLAGPGDMPYFCARALNILPWRPNASGFEAYTI